ncbi:ornithine cyclodeaminase family protein [Pseudonocardia kunmingensis]|uniref:Ornithine cyclodeaminase n=1 Tax=Pseudonocardia kunmingensis TaxID=630975 RepID=A0A543DMY6_9PSEU|nr:ornithine cyclodeaminase family protein [Pseudonocardia kunmingensis]TQM10710.1 ornithine cyclodeaminase [Pseudonocardia kunmingensis]
MRSDPRLRFYGAQEVRERVPPRRARELVEAALAGGFDPATDPARVHTPAGAGHLLLMPSTLGGWCGVKVASVAPGNPAAGLPRIQATYVLMDAATLTPRAILDGASLTALRTPAVSAVAADRLAPPGAAELLVFGTGPQAVEHVVALADIRRFARVRVVGRSAARVSDVLAQVAARGVPAEAGSVEHVAGADVVACATAAGEPLFDGARVRDGACVVAIGSHEPDRRELDAGLMGRALVVVEDPGTALREAGDVVRAVAEGTLAADGLVGLGALVRGEVARREDRPNVFKGTGMAWQDLAVAAGVVADDADGT